MNGYLRFELCFEVDEDLASSFRFDGSLTIFKSRIRILEMRRRGVQVEKRFQNGLKSYLHFAVNVVLVRLFLIGKVRRQNEDCFR